MGYETEYAKPNKKAGYFFAFTGIKSADLKKGFFGKPSPYIKINVFPRVRHAAAAQKHHGFQGKSTVKQGSADPVWEKEVNVIIDLYQ